MTKDPERLTVVRRHHSIPLVTLLVALTALPALAQPPTDQGRNELIVLLAPSPPAPRPEEIADAVNGRGPVPGGLAEGNPEHAEVLGYPAKGRLLEYVLANPESAEARLTRYLLLRFPVHVNLDGIATALSRNPAS